MRLFAAPMLNLLIPILEDTLKDYDNVTLLNEDILKVDLCRLAE